VLLGETRISVSAERGWSAPIGAAVGVRLDPDRACFFRPDGTTAVHRAASETTPISQRDETPEEKEETDNEKALSEKEGLHP